MFTSPKPTAPVHKDLMAKSLANKGKTIMPRVVPGHSREKGRIDA
jgi:hypothetical protein